MTTDDSPLKIHPPRGGRGGSTRRIGLSLGADLCWPKVFEDILGDLDLSLDLGGEQVRFEAERMTIEPFGLRQQVGYDVVVDRLTHWYDTSREWIKKAVILDGCYVFNNPWAVQSMEKQTTYCAMMRLGLPIPDTWLVPPKEYEESADLRTTLESYARLFDLGQVGSKIGYPLFMKPYDGGGWVGVSKIDDEQALRDAYDESGKFVMHLQKGVVPFESFVRGIGLGPQVLTVKYDPSAALHERYQQDRNFLGADDLEVVRDITLTINAFFGWDFNSCEMLLAEGVWYPIDFANPCPDSQVTSLHIHFPDLVKAKLRWALFCAATRRPFRHNLDWQPFFAIAEQENLSYREKLSRYARLARQHFEAEAFEDFCSRHLGQLDEVTHAYFGTERAREAVRTKVAALFPEHEHGEFTELFWSRIQDWRQQEGGPR